MEQGNNKKVIVFQSHFVRKVKGGEGGGAKGKSVALKKIEVSLQTDTGSTSGDLCRLKGVDGLQLTNLTVTRTNQNPRSSMMKLNDWTYKKAK